MHFNENAYEDHVTESRPVQLNFAIPISNLTSAAEWYED
jgi:hypothetical protein